MADFTTLSRSKRDFYSNPTFGETLQVLEKMIDAETTKMRSQMRGADLASINRSAGVVDGIELAMRRLMEEREQALTGNEDEEQKPEYMTGMFDAAARTTS